MLNVAGHDFKARLCIFHINPSTVCPEPHTSVIWSVTTQADHKVNKPISCTTQRNKEANQIVRNLMTVPADAIIGDIGAPKNMHHLVIWTYAFHFFGVNIRGLLTDYEGKWPTQLHWNLQHTKAHASTTFWSLWIWCLSRVTNGLKLSDARQLYMTVSVPGFTYGSEVWYTPTFKLTGTGKMKGSVAMTNKLCSTQHKVAKTVTRVLSSTTRDILDTHTNLFPIDLLFRKILFRATICIYMLPQSHPLYAAIREAVHRSIRHHCLLLHNLLLIANISPNSVETISTVRHSPGHTEAFRSFICSSKEQALEKIEVIEHAHPVQVFCDGSGFKGGVGALAVLYIDNHIIKVLHYHLGLEKEHTVYKLKV